MKSFDALLAALKKKQDATEDEPGLDDAILMHGEDCATFY